MFFDYKSKHVFREVHAPANRLSAYMQRTFGVHAEPPNGGEFAMNFLLHVLVLFTVLTLLFVTVIIPLESKTITKELNGACNQAVNAGFAALKQQLAQASPAARAATIASLKASVPKLQQLQTQYAAAPDPTVVQQNKKTLGVAYAIIAVLVTTLVVLVFSMAGTGVQVGLPVARVALEKVASKFVPIMPSALGTTVLQALTEEFPVPPTPAATESVV